MKKISICGLSLMTGLLLSTGSALEVYRWEQIERKANFEKQVDTLQSVLQTYLAQSEQAAQSLADLYSITPQLNEPDFNRIADRLLQEYEILANIGLAQRFSGLELTRQSRGVWHIGEKGDVESTSINATDEYFVSVLSIGKSDEEKMLNFNHSNDWQRQAAIARARDVGILAVTAQVHLAGNQAKGFVIYIPIYQSLALESQESRQEQFTGAAYLSIDSQTLLTRSTQSLKSGKIEVYLYGMPVDQLDSALFKSLDSLSENLLVTYGSDEFPPAFIQNLSKQSVCPFDAKNLFCLRSLNWVNREWSILVLPRDEILEQSWRSISVLILGYGITLLLSLYFCQNQKQKQQQEYLIKALMVTSISLKEEKNQAEFTLKKLMETQAQLVHTEKMSSLGQLVAGIAHEINNPIGFVYSNIRHLTQYVDDLLCLLDLYESETEQTSPNIQSHIEAMELEFVREDLPKIVESMKMGAQRIQELVGSMRNFSRLDEAKLKQVQINEGLESTLLILSHRLKAKGGMPPIKVIRNYGMLPLVECAPGQINQVFMNLLSNSIDALEEAVVNNAISQEPRIEITTQGAESGWIQIEISDNGPGIPNEVRSRIFDPFFTTKPTGKGTGLGLYISYQIIHDFHGGRLQCHSIPGEGTQFIITLPIHAQKSALVPSLVG